MGDATWWSAREGAGRALTTGPAVSVPLVQSSHRTLAEDVAALVDLPRFPTAAMDGWVVSGPGPWVITGTIDTGVPAARDLSAGQAMRIATGGVIPGGANAVIPWEIALVTGSQLVAELPEKVHIRPRGEECKQGDVMAHRGENVNPALLGLLAASGIDEVRVVVEPRVAVLVLGDEVVSAGLPAPGQVRDALGVQLPGWIAALGGKVESVRRIADDPRELIEVLAQSVAESDVVVATGGTARGHRDFLRSALQDIGAEFLIDGVAVRPGHPMMLARSAATPIVGLPGNPLSALVAVVTLLAPMLDTWLGRADRELPQVHMAEGVAASRKELTRLMVGRRELGGFRQVSHVSSGMLRGIAHADGWAVIPSAGVDAGAVVPWIPLPWIRRS